MINPIYNGIYNLLVTYIYGAVQTGTYQELVCILAATTLSLYAIALPFIAVHGIIKLFFPRGVI